VLHLAWDHGQLGVFGWQDRALPADRARSLVSSLFGHGLTPSSFELTIPGRTQVVVAHGATLSLGQAADAFCEQTWVPWRTLSVSLGWAARAYGLAAQLVDGGQVVPNLDPRSGATSWIPMVDEGTADSLRFLAQQMPPVFGCQHVEAQAWQLTSALINGFVDVIVRERLWGTEAGGPDARDRRPVAVVSRRVLGSLISSERVVANNDNERMALRALAEEMARWSARLTSRSPLVDCSVFVRLEPIEPQHGLDPSDSHVRHSIEPEHEPLGSDEACDTNQEIVSSDPAETPDDLWSVELAIAPVHDPSLLVDSTPVWDPAASLPPGVDRATAQATLRFARVRLQEVSPTLAARLDKHRPAGAVLPFDAIMQVVTDDLEAINKTGIVVQLPLWWAKPKAARTLGRATPTDSPVVSAGLTAKAVVSIDWRVALGDQVLSDDELNQLAQSKYGIVKLTGRWIAVDQTTVARALTTVMRLRNRTAKVSAVDLLNLDLEPDVELASSGWVEALLSRQVNDQVEPVVSPHGFVGTLRPYQQRGVGWLAFLSRVGLGALLADDMGLGKTAQVLALIAHERSLNSPPHHPTLVVCPVSVVHNWELEAARFVPSLRVGVHHGSARTSADDFAPWVNNHDVVITTFATATGDVDSLETVQWDRVIIDEAQHIKNARTKAARALRRIPARQRVALTGTPIENRLSDLWALMDLINPGILGTAEHFRRTVAVPIERHQDEAATTRLRSLISPVMLRRSKADKSLVPELPAKIEATAWATLTREQASLYRAVTDQLLERLPTMTNMNRRGAIIATITRLKQICNHPVHFLGDGSRLEGRSGKLARLDELLDDAFEVGDRVIAFTQYVEMGLLVQRHLANRNQLSVPFLNGSVPKSRRDKLVEAFQSGSVPLLLVSLKAGGSGLNLTAANQVIHIDRWWNPAVEDQASDRAWRIGQTSTVFVHRLATRGTIEERIDTLLDEKRMLADSVIGTGQGTERWITELSTEDLRRLLVLEQP
jgi:superfamily II DNA or RNA helicase